MDEEKIVQYGRFEKYVAGLLEEDPNIQEECHNQLMGLQSENLILFLSFCSYLLDNEDSSHQMMIMTLILLKHAFTPGKFGSYKQMSLIWMDDSMTSERQAITNSTIVCLCMNDEVIRNMSAAVFARMFILYNKEWPIGFECVISNLINGNASMIEKNAILNVFSELFSLKIINNTMDIDEIANICVLRDVVNFLIGDSEAEIGLRIKSANCLAQILHYCPKLYYDSQLMINLVKTIESALPTDNIDFYSELHHALAEFVSSYYASLEVFEDLIIEILNVDFSLEDISQRKICVYSIFRILEKESTYDVVAIGRRFSYIIATNYLSSLLSFLNQSYPNDDYIEEETDPSLETMTSQALQLMFIGMMYQPKQIPEEFFGEYIKFLEYSQQKQNYVYDSGFLYAFNAMVFKEPEIEPVTNYIESKTRYIESLTYTNIPRLSDLAFSTLCHVVKEKYQIIGLYDNFKNLLDTAESAINSDIKSSNNIKKACMLIRFLIEYSPAAYVDQNFHEIFTMITDAIGYYINANEISFLITPFSAMDKFIKIIAPKRPEFFKNYLDGQLDALEQFRKNEMISYCILGSITRIVQTNEVYLSEDQYKNIVRSAYSLYQADLSLFYEVTLIFTSVVRRYPGKLDIFIPSIIDVIHSGLISQEHNSIKFSLYLFGDLCFKLQSDCYEIVAEASNLLFELIENTDEFTQQMILPAIFYAFKQAVVALGKSIPMDTLEHIWNTLIQRINVQTDKENKDEIKFENDLYERICDCMAEILKVMPVDTLTSNGFILEIKQVVFKVFFRRILDDDLDDKYLLAALVNLIDVLSQSIICKRINLQLNGSTVSNLMNKCIRCNIVSKRATQLSYYLRTL